MSRLKSVNLLLLLLLVMPACTRQSRIDNPATSITVELILEPDPPVVGEGMVYLEIHDENGLPVDGLNIQVKGDMTHAGMTPVFAASTYEGEGRYKIPFEWTMAGDWILQVGADLPDGRVLNRSFEARVQSE